MRGLLGAGLALLIALEVHTSRYYILYKFGEDKVHDISDSQAQRRSSHAQGT